MSLKNKLNGIKEIWQFQNHWHLLFNRLFFPNEKINIYRYKNFEILIDHSAGDANGARQVLTSDMYRKFLSKMNLSNSIKVLDLGANNGGFPLLLKSEKFTINKLVCVEFNPKTYSRLVFNIERNLNCDFTPANVALTGKSKTFEVGFGKDSTSDNIFQTNPEGEKFKIQGQTLDELYTTYFQNEIIDICKIDVEGAEFEVFEKDNYSELKNCKYILMEIHHENETPRAFVQKKIYELGFEELDKDEKTDEFHYVHLFVNKNL